MVLVGSLEWFNEPVLYFVRGMDVMVKEIGGCDKLSILFILKL